MKIYILILLIFSLSCNNKVEKIEKRPAVNDLSKIKTKDTLNHKYGNVTKNLPYGSKIITDYQFPKKWRYTSVFSDDYNSNEINKNSKKINYIDSTFNSKHSLNKNWTINYMIDTTSIGNNLKIATKNITHSSFRLIEILPEINKTSVVLRNYKDEKKGIFLIELSMIKKT